MRDSKAEFQFLDFAPPKPIPRPADDSKKRAAEPVSAVSSDGSDDYRSKLRAMRPVAYGLLAFWIGLYVVVACFAGWL